MLKRLELIGFKSFADKTRFDFAPGITAVVGPNGSGKSNIVDAVKWVLGEQSAKSLRGGEMADVIFNGSTTRKSLGLAEVTMAFDNSRRQLNFDGDEVQVTRRVYRDGQGEYLINGVIARLKDIKELFLGSGAGHGAYSVIEQGRVDALLTASTKDRRVIFEEAAGISRFKAKKLEALRKLERVDADLNRVRDLLQELEKNLRTLTAQAAKAQKYQEYHARLRELRIGLGLREYAEIAAKLAEHEELLRQLQADTAEAAAKTETGEAEARKLDWELARTEDALRVQEKRLGEARQQIAAQDAVVKSGREQLRELAAELLRIGKQRADLGQRIRGLETDTAKAVADAADAAQHVTAMQARADAAAAALNVVAATIAELTRQTQEDRDRQFDYVNRAAQLHTASEVNREQVERLTRELTRKQAEAGRFSAEADGLARVLTELSRDDADLQQKLTAARQLLSERQHEQAELRRQADMLQPELEQLRERRSDLRGRADVLEGLERSLEGLGAGVRAVLERTRCVESPVLGLVADLITAPREVAPLIDVALGDAAQRFVVRNTAALDTMLADFGCLPGRVGFIPLPSTLAEQDGQGTNSDCDLAETNFINTPLLTTTGREEIIPLSTLVDSDLPGLADLLLGKVLLAKDLATARVLSLAHPDYRVVTLASELLEPDGTLIVGPPQTEAGILSRKSELRELREQVIALDVRIQQLDSAQTEFRRQADQLDAPITGLWAEIEALAGEADSLRDRIVVQREKHARLVEQIELLAAEADLLREELSKAEAAWYETRGQAEAIDAAARELKSRLDQADAELRAKEQLRDTRQQENTEAQVALGRVQQQLAAAQARCESLDAELRQRKVEAVNLTAQERSIRTRLTEVELAMLRATALAADAYREKEERERRAAELSTQRDKLRADRERVQNELKKVRNAWSARRDKAHEHELTVRELQGRRDALESRIREDYGVELANLLTDDAHRSAVEGATKGPPAVHEMTIEIEELKRKIAKLGSVNLEALEQLAEAEAREQDIRRQHDDLTEAEQALLEIIEQINTDSRKLFTETLAAVRRHFQELFRKLFGGGMADIVLEDDADVLESGIEITARPPGKELRSISLLSGGEKTLTAIALLLAIFRSKPSPFCLLDEVDAALDEANAVRLASVLHEFRSSSQFIIITHKKRTMAAADVLHGVTMQESGVSKKVAIRFEDWPEDEPQLQQGAA
jgi:chromosome segregation protein